MLETNLDLSTPFSCCCRTPIFFRHNYNLGHPWENGVIYGDSTSVMGQVYRNKVYNCYNGVHYAYTGWMSNATLEIDVVNSTNDGIITTDLAFYGHINRTDAAMTTALIIINGFHILYNRATGMNAETNEYANGVLLHRYKEENAIEAGTDLVAVLELSENTDAGMGNRLFRSTEFGFAIELCSRNDATSMTEADTVTIAIGPTTEEFLCTLPNDDSMISDVPSTSPVPSSSPVPSDMNSDVPSVRPVVNRQRRGRRQN
jgi:Gametolysin peptidase M11